MLIIDLFHNKERYISPEDELEIYSEVSELLAIWKEIIVKNSNNRITDLTPEYQEKLSNIISNIDKKIYLSQLDRKFIEIILWGASNFFHQKQIIDEIYKKTKNAVFQYFHHDLIILAYLKVKDSESAINVIKNMYDKNHVSYFYTILKYDASKFEDKKFAIKLTEYQEKIIIKLLAKGETVDLKNVNFTKLLEIIEKVKENIASDLAK